MIELQRDDGSWSAEQSGGERRGDLRASALMVTSLLACGPLEPEDHQQAMVRGVRWLVAAMDKRGRIGFSPEPDWLLDHAIATHALLEALRLEPRSTGVSRDAVVRAVRALERGAAETKNLSMELRLWSHLCRNVARALTIECGDLGTLPWQAIAPATPSETLAEALYRSLADGKETSEEVFFAQVPKVALDDPLATTYASILAYLQGGRTWKRMFEWTRTGVDLRARRNGAQEPAQWEWDGAGSFRAIYGAAGTTACAILVLRTWYRANRLLVCE